MAYLHHCTVTQPNAYHAGSSGLLGFNGASTGKVTEASGSSASETSVTIYQSTRRNITED
jgi:hypothetical protein